MMCAICSVVRSMYGMFPYDSCDCQLCMERQVIKGHLPMAIAVLYTCSSDDDNFMFHLTHLQPSLADLNRVM